MLSAFVSERYENPRAEALRVGHRVVRIVLVALVVLAMVAAASAEGGGGEHGGGGSHAGWKIELAPVEVDGESGCHVSCRRTRRLTMFGRERRSQMSARVLGKTLAYDYLNSLAQGQTTLVNWLRDRVGTINAIEAERFPLPNMRRPKLERSFFSDFPSRCG
jgi:hypothetical protein